jgi:hypothetical protein
MEDLIAHEAKPGRPPLEPPPSYLEDHAPPQYSSSSDEDEDMEEGPVGGASSVSWVGAGGGFDDVEAEIESSEEEEFTVKVNGSLMFVNSRDCSSVHV